MTYPLIIIGAGAAGLMAAIQAQEYLDKILILEGNERPGKKILISGGGRCNFTNLKVSSEDYVSENPHFVKSALNQFSNHDFINWIKENNIDSYEKTLGQLFCKKSSREILDLLLQKLDPTKVTLLCNKKVIDVSKTEQSFLCTLDSESFESKNLIIASGGLSHPKLGVSDLAYRIAKNFNHQVTQLAPALDSLIWNQNEKLFFQDLPGISLKSKVRIEQKSFCENILFTHQGISGPAILKASLYWQPDKKISINFLPDLEDLESYFTHQRQKEGKKSLSKCLKELLPDRFAEKTLENLKIPSCKLAELKKEDQKKLTRFLSQFEFIPKSSSGYEKAEVTRGGVSTKNLHSKTLESKLIPGLYFIGEAVDVTGLLGGYNFQWAWSSGFVAGKSFRHST